MDIYFSADVETDGPIPGPFSVLSFAIVVAGTFDGTEFVPASAPYKTFYRELQPISDDFQPEALQVNGLDREKLIREGAHPEAAMNEAYEWILSVCGSAKPVLVAYPLSFDWSWLYWYFTKFCAKGSPFGHSRCYDIKTAVAVKGRRMISDSGRSRLPVELMADSLHTHHALDDAIEQAEIFGKVFNWVGKE